MYRLAYRLSHIVATFAALTVSSFAMAQAPIPVVDGYVTSGFAGWTKLTEGLPTSVSYVHRPDNRALAGAFVWFETVPTVSATEAFTVAAQTHKIANLKILATRKVERAVLLDSGGTGMTVMGEGVRGGVPIRMIAFVFYGSTNGTPRQSGVHGFAAPTAIYEALGGWIVPASLWMKLDPQREVGDVRAQGSASPAAQTVRFAGIANMWAQWALRTMQGLAQGNIAAMSSARQTIICAGDPQCRLVPAD